MQKMRSHPVLDETRRLFKITGAKTVNLHLWSEEKKTFTITNKDGTKTQAKLNPELISKMQRYNKETTPYIGALIQTPDYDSLNDVGKAEVMSSLQQQIATATMIKFLGHNIDKKSTHSANAIADGILHKDPDKVMHILKKMIKKESLNKKTHKKQYVGAND